MSDLARMAGTAGLGLIHGYLALLRLPLGSRERLTAEPAMAALRDTIATRCGLDAETVQVTCEEFVAKAAA